MRKIALTLLILVAAAWHVRAGDVPLGHKDFYPSPERPVGFRGDGNGWYPGATPVTEWWEGTPVEKELERQDRGKPRKDKYWDFADAASKNLVWKAELPSWCNTQPLVVGDRVFSYGEPDFLYCVDANTGKLLWSQCLNAWECAGVDPAKAKTARELMQINASLYRVIELQFHFGTCGRYLSAEQLKPLLQMFLDKEWPGIQAALKQFDPQGDYAAGSKVLTDLIQGAITTHVDGKSGWDYGKKCGKILNTLNQRIQALTGKRVPTESPWGNMVGWNMSVPVSDGRFVYAAMGQGQTACLGLDGKVIWRTFFDQKGPSTHHVLSPLLAGGILIDMHGDGTLRGLDAKTGKPVWEAPTSAAVKSTRSGYYVASHRIVKLGGTDYLVTSQCNILRVKDGKVVGEVPFGPAYGGGAPLAGYGDIILKCANGDGWSEPFRAFKLTKVTEDQVKAELLWQSDVKGSYETRIVTPNATFLCGATFACDTQTGKAKSSNRELGGTFRILAGNTFISVGGGSSNGLGSAWSHRRADGKAMMAFLTADVTDPANPRVLSRSNVLGGLNAPRDPGGEKYLPNLWKEAEFFNAKGGKPAHMLHADTCMCPSGNRLFIRTVSHLYCLGDPQVQYDWNPASRPQDISAALKQ